MKQREKRRPGRPRAERPETLGGAIGARVEELRKKAGLKSVELASAAEIPLSTLLKLEAGTMDVKVSVLAQVAAGLDLTPEKMLRGVEGWSLN